MKAGDTFKLLGEDIHLWIVLSDPEIDTHRVLLVNFTTWNARHDPACVLDGGEHAFLHHRSCVNYAEARVYSLLQLSSMQQDGLIEPHDRLSPDLLRRIRNCAGDSRRIALEYYQMLEDQGLLDYED